MYKFIYTDGDSYTYNDTSFIVRKPDGNTNPFTTFSLSMLAIYNFLAGDKNAFEPWELQNDPYLAILVVLFSFLIMVYLMNLFIGLLSNEIQNHDTEEAFYTQKAKVITSFELLFNKHQQLHPYFM
ncbi:1262_t:CDS:2 [Entrophospora sp. SA101]|nr:1262_t:CDS:2 [Entrophospora sp. SA101]